MRHILCNYARDRRAQKRGGAFEFTELDSSVNVAVGDPASHERPRAAVASDAARV
jgi:hypothetical protein